MVVQLFLLTVFSQQLWAGESGEPRGPEQTLATYRAALSHLREMSGQESVDTLVSNYLQAENDNYTLFTYISDLNNEVIYLQSFTIQKPHCT